MSTEGGTRPLPLLEHLGSLPDPRRSNRRHSLAAILAMTVCSVLIGAESWNDIAEFSEMRRDWFAAFLDLSHGVPSHDTFNRVFALLDPDAFARHFAAWTSSLATHLDGVIAIDGKTLRGSRWQGGGALHMVSAWSASNGLVLASLAVDAKSNEITAVPELLSLLHLQGAIVTVDAMHCQRSTAAAITARDGDYIMAVKENQPTLLQDTRVCFTAAAGASATTVNKGHGRLEHRRHTVVSDHATIAYLRQEHAWPSLGAVARVQSRREHSDGRVEEAERFYLLSRSMTPEALGAAVRAHWGIENNLHWSLDVIFQEDRSRSRLAAQNLARVRQMCLNLLRLTPQGTASLRTRRKLPAVSDAYLVRVLHAGDQLPTTQNSTATL